MFDLYCYCSVELSPKLVEWFESLTVRRAVRTIDSSSRRIDSLAEFMLNEEFCHFIQDLMETLDTNTKIDDD